MLTFDQRYLAEHLYGDKQCFGRRTYPVHQYAHTSGIGVEFLKILSLSFDLSLLLCSGW